ncbi:MAG: hypothetical protein EG823_02705 [Actinobacteria bacterium]|nr:hypothetical protein [Actinomycetota bacterium]
MLPLALGFVGFTVLALIASIRDEVGLGLLLSSRVDRVAEVRLDEPAFGIPALYIVASATAGVGVVTGLPDVPPLARWALGVVIASFLLLTIWDMRRRRGTLAVYIRLRRTDISFMPRGEVIEVPKLVFLVMNQPTPIVWLLTSILLGGASVVLAMDRSWAAVLPLAALAIAVFWLWFRNRRNPWEPLARRLRWLSLLSGQRLEDALHRALDLDPEVALLREAADAVVARFIGKDD